MASVRCETLIDARLEDVWSAVADAGAVAGWFPGLLKSEMIDATRRRCVTASIEVVEEIVTSDDSLHRFQYRIVEGPVGFEFHLATVDLLPLASGTLAIYGAEVLPDSAGEAMQQALTRALQGLKRYAEGVEAVPPAMAAPGS